MAVKVMAVQPEIHEEIPISKKTRRKLRAELELTRRKLSEERDQAN